MEPAAMKLVVGMKQTSAWCGVVAAIASELVCPAVMCSGCEIDCELEA